MELKITYCIPVKLLQYYSYMFGLGVPELLIILVIILLLFGGKKLPELSRSIGQSFKEIKNGLSGDQKSAKKKAGRR